MLRSEEPHEPPALYVSADEHAQGAVGDCDCGACVEQVGVKLPPLRLAAALPPEMPLVPSPDLVVQRVGEHWVVFQAARGHLMVMNESGYALLAGRASLTRAELLTRPEARFLAALAALEALLPAEKPPAPPGPRPTPDTYIAWLHLTNKCSLRCQYCYVDKTAEHMCVETAEQAVEAIFAVASGRYGRVKLKYAGGEPTLAADLLMHTHRHAASLAAHYGVTLSGNILSNGLHAPPRLIEFTREHGLAWAISLDGLGTEHDAQRVLPGGRPSSGRVLATIDELQRHGVEVHIPITVTRLNLAGLPELVGYLLERGLRFSISFYRQNRYSQDRLGLYPTNEELIATMRRVYEVIAARPPAYSLLALLLDRVDLRAPHDHPCAAGRNYLAVGHKGDVSPCQMLLSHQAHTRIELLPTAPQLQSEHFQNLAAGERTGCAPGCVWRAYCAGGCPIEAFHGRGSFAATSPYCEVYAALAPEVLRIEALRLLRYQRPLVLS